MRVLLFTILFTNIAFGSSWPRGNNPIYFESELSFKLNQLPSHADISNNYTMWPGNHWASNFGGIAQRWSSGKPQHFSYHRYSLKELQKIEPHLLNELSPAEKYDIYMGRYDYPTVKREWKRTSPSNASWFGICHGVAPAALNHPEPQTITVINRDKIKIQFYSSDVKALMSYYYATHSSSKTIQVGKRCNTRQGGRLRRGQRRACSDMDPAVFHILITNFIGLKGKSFIVDIDPNNEVWNHLPNAYSYEIYEESDPSENSTIGTVKRLWIGLEVSYASTIAQSFHPVIGTPAEIYFTNNYQYFLDINSRDEIIGGHWISDLRPDFIWNRPKTKFRGYWSKINDIYRPRY